LGRGRIAPTEEGLVSGVNRSIWPALVLALLLPATPLRAQEPVPQPAPKPAPKPAPIDTAAWLEGEWTGQGIGGAPAGETWSRAGGQMVGHFWQLADDGSVMFYELITLAAADTGGLVMRLKHFGADLAGWEAQGAEAAESFPLTAWQDGRLDFSGLTYQRDGADGLIVRVVVQASAETQETLEFRFRRAPPASLPPTSPGASGG
jgi:hypothetical protein